MSKTSGAAKRRRRVERGLPRYTEADIASRARHEAKRSKWRGKRQYDERRVLIDNIKLSRGCADCGYKAHPAALQFDHLPGTVKVRNVAQMSDFTSLENLYAEIEKCEVVCANCHAIRTVERRRNGEEGANG